MIMGLRLKEMGSLLRFDIDLRDKKDVYFMNRK